MSILSCSAPDCTKPLFVKKRQLCQAHYNRFMSYGDLNIEVPATECRRCRSPIVRERKGHGPSPKYCTVQCHYLAGRESHIESGAYEATKAAKREANKLKPLHRLACVRCGTGFESRHKAPRFCSQNCGNKWRNENNIERCSIEGCDRGMQAKGLCSMHWRRKARADGREANPAWTESRKASYHKRRAQKFGTQTELLRPIDIYERDIWLCGLCSTPVDPAAQHPDPMSPSLDHIKPLSLGGTHTYENVQLAHLTCNVSKGNRVAA